MDYLKYRWTNTVSLVYTTYISVDLVHHEIFCAKVGKVGKGGIILVTCHINIDKSRLKKSPKTKTIPFIV